MKAAKLLYGILLLFLVLILSGCDIPFLKKKKAALQVLAEPKATVFLNGNHVGQTPYFDEQLKPGEYTLKVVPDSNSGETLLTWQAMVKLYPGIMTVVSRSLAAADDKSSGYILTLEPIADKDKGRISIITTPDGAVVNLDGEPKGFTPLAIDDVLEGEKILIVSSPGFKEETIKAKVVNGYKLMIDIQLAKKEEESEETDEDKQATESAKKTNSDKKDSNFDVDEDKQASEGAEMAKPYVKIKETPTEWLNVRSEPSTAGSDETILTKIYPDEVYKFIEANDTGWYKIEYKKGEQGWISGKYATLYK